MFQKKRLTETVYLLQFAFLDVSVRNLPFSLRGETPQKSRFLSRLRISF